MTKTLEMVATIILTLISIVLIDKVLGYGTISYLMQGFAGIMGGLTVAGLSMKGETK